MEELEIRVIGEYLSNLRFANNIALLSNSGAELQFEIIELDKKSRKAGLKVNLQKTKVMYNNLEREQRFEMGSNALEVVKEYVYLGEIVTTELKHKIEVTGKIKMGCSTFDKHYEIMTGSVR